MSKNFNNLIPRDPIQFPFLSEKGATPALYEIELAGKLHRYHSINNLMKKFYNNIEDRIIVYEKALFNLLGFQYTKDLDNFNLTSEMETGIDYLANELSNDLSNDIFPYFLFSAYSISADELKKILRNMYTDLKYDPDVINALMARFPTPNRLDSYYSFLERNALNKVKTEIAYRNMRFIREIIATMTRNNASIMEIANYLRKTVGQGHLWYWLRIVRSETVLAWNAMYKESGERMGIKYSKWSAAIGACPICAALDGRVWRFNESPEPVTSTHPHCLCCLIPFTEYTGAINSRWTRETPYDRPYQLDEINDNFNLQ